MSIVTRIMLSLAFAATLVMQFELVADEKKKDPQPDAKMAVKVFAVDAALAATDAKDKSAVGGYFKTYKQKLTEGRSYQIDLSSKAFDAFLRLEDAKGKKLAENDDGAGKGTDARLKFTPAKTAEYTIVCTTFTPNATGKFSLTIHDVTDGPVAPSK